MNNSKRVTEGALLIALYVILLLIAIFIPAAILIVVFLLPIPFVIYASRHDLKYAIVMFLATLILTLLLATFISLPLTILAGLGGLMIGTGIRQRIHPYETWARGTIGFIAGIVFIYLFSQFVLQVNWMEEIDVVIDDSMEMSEEIVDSFGLGQEFDEEKDLIKGSLDQIKDLLPVEVSIAALLLAFITQWLSYKVINRTEQKGLKFPPFRTLRLPVAMIWIYFVLIILTFFEFDEASTIYSIVLNFHVLVGLFIALQGFSFIFYFAHYKKWPIAIPIVSVVVTILLPLLLLYLVRIIGIIDIGFRMRDRLTNNDK